jgi:hypothetical protein
MRWTKEQLRDYETRRASSSAKPERAIQNEPVATPKRKAVYAGKVHVRIRSFRTRLLDPDNLCAKYFVDCLRYSGLIPDDRAEDITLEVSQVKVNRSEQRTEVEVILSETGNPIVKP